MKSIVLLALMVIAASVLLAVNEPGALQLREDDSFWRLTFKTYMGSSWPGGEGSNSNSSYYYNATHPSQLDSLVEVVSAEEYYTMKHYYTREDFDDYYQITIDKGYENGAVVDRIINRYNYQELLLEMLVYNINYTTNQLEFSYRNEYTYDNSGNRCTTKFYGSTNILLSMQECTYNSQNLLTLEKLFRKDTETGTLYQYYQEDLFYSQFCSPDSVHYWQLSAPVPNYALYNSFDAFGHIIISELISGSNHEKTYSAYLYAEQDLYLPLYHKTYNFTVEQGNIVPGDSTFTIYTYSNNFRTIHESQSSNGHQFSNCSFNYNYAWKLISESGSSNYVDFGSNWSAAYTWEFYTEVSDEVISQPQLWANIFPNPVTSSSQLSYKLLVPAEVVITIYNLKGQLVERKIIGKQAKGEHTAALPNTKLPSGVYYLRIEAGLTSQTTKFLVLK